MPDVSAHYHRVRRFLEAGAVESELSELIFSDDGEHDDPSRRLQVRRACCTEILVCGVSDCVDDVMGDVKLRMAQHSWLDSRLRRTERR